MPGHKLTVRLDPRELDLLIKLTQVLGASKTAVVQALISSAGEMFEAHNWVHPSQWPTNNHTVTALAHQAAEKAKIIDSTRRSRS